MLQLKNKDLFQFDNKTVIIPSICVGNAAQLACDLIISSKQLKRIGIITHPALIPIFGPSAYQHEPTEKAAACEIYESEQDKLVVIQIRTPLISKHTPNFHAELVQLVEKAQRVILLSGSFGFEKRVIESSPYSYKATKEFKLAHARLPAMVWKEFEGEVIYGGGNGMQLYKLLEERHVPTMLLFRYLLEGDNTMDASLILRELNGLCEELLQMYEKSGGAIKLTVPVSWKLLFGNDVTEQIF